MIKYSDVLKSEMACRATAREYILSYVREFESISQCALQIPMRPDDLGKRMKSNSLKVLCDLCLIIKTKKDNPDNYLFNIKPSQLRLRT